MICEKREKSLLSWHCNCCHVNQVSRDARTTVGEGEGVGVGVGVGVGIGDHSFPVPALYRLNGTHQRSKIRGDRGL